MAEQATPTFKKYFKKLSILFALLSLGMYVYVWKRHPGVIPFLDHAFLYQAPLIAVQCVIAWALGAAEAVPASKPRSTSENSFFEEEEIVVNPATGFTMFGGMGGIDAAGNTYGHSSDD